MAQCEQNMDNQQSNIESKSVCQSDGTKQEEDPGVANTEERAVNHSSCLPCSSTMMVEGDQDMGGEEEEEDEDEGDGEDGEDGEGGIVESMNNGNQQFTLEHLSELACQIELERKDKYASTSNGNSVHVALPEVNKNNLTANQDAQNIPNACQGIDDFALPLWVKVHSYFSFPLALTISLLIFSFERCEKAPT